VTPEQARFEAEERRRQDRDFVVLFLTCFVVAVVLVAAVVAVGSAR
jgi:hypothetical protein